MSTDNLAKGSQTCQTHHQHLSNLYFDSFLSHLTFFFLIGNFTQAISIFFFGPQMRSMFTMRNQRGSALLKRTQVHFFSSYIYVYMQTYTHIYCRYTCTVCIVTYMLLYQSKPVIKRLLKVIAAGYRRSNSNWEPTASGNPVKSSDKTQIRRTWKEETQIKTTTHKGDHMILGTPGEMTAEKLKAPPPIQQRCMLCRTLYSGILLWIGVYRSNICAN